jgi:hypothetical protein
MRRDAIRDVDGLILRLFLLAVNARFSASIGPDVYG